MNKEELLRELNKLDFEKMTVNNSYRELCNIANKIGAHGLRNVMIDDLEWLREDLRICIKEWL
jgi:hypothetical protein